MTARADRDRFDQGVRALFARRPERMVPGLERIAALAEALGHPERRMSAVHLTGTNGKTSLARMVTALLQADGRLPGTYTSPHLQTVRERIRVGGRPISENDFVAGLDALAPHLAAVEAARGEMVTFFEALTALAYHHFAAAGVDTAVVEVGMGGRWDATNVIDAEVAVINPVRLDHAELGSRVEQVAWEKAGIISDGGVCVSAAQWPGARDVIAAEASTRGARLLEAGRDFALARRQPHAHGQRIAIDGLGGSVADVELPLHGAHQADNAAVALAAVESLLGGLDPETARAGFSAVRTPGRLEVVPGDVPVVLDGAHNPAGAEALAVALEEELPYRRRVLVVGAMGDKDTAGIIEALLPVADSMICAEAPTSRSAPAGQLAKVAKLAGREAVAEPDIVRAVARARELADPDAVVVVTGSLYLVGAARDALGLDIG